MEELKKFKFLGKLKINGYYENDAFYLTFVKFTYSDFTYSYDLDNIELNYFVNLCDILKNCYDEDNITELRAIFNSSVFQNMLYKLSEYDDVEQKLANIIETCLGHQSSKRQAVEQFIDREFDKSLDYIYDDAIIINRLFELYLQKGLNGYYYIDETSY